MVDDSAMAMELAARSGMFSRTGVYILVFIANRAFDEQYFLCWFWRMAVYV